MPRMELLLRLTEVLAVSGDDLKVGSDVASASVTATVMKQEKTKRSLYTNTKEKPDTIRKTATDKHTHRLKSTRSMHNGNRRRIV